MMRIATLLLLVLPMSGCYYMQAAAGQLEVLRKRDAIDDIIADPATPAELTARLTLVTEARDFSVNVLKLPDNDSYRSYADLERDYVVWNVFAAPEFELRPKTWCYPVAGCVSYRGYFSRDKAIKEARRLEKQGMDVSVGGVAAYSTLGKFDDPLLSTMMQWDDVRLVAVLFHELAHQVVYVKGDSAFNESFATAVEEFGVRRWLESRNESDLLQDYLADRQMQQQLMGVVADARTGLGKLYASDIGDAAMRVAKQAQLASLSNEMAEVLVSQGRDASRWQAAHLNNARLITMILYEGRLPEFRAMLRDCDEDIACFYLAAKTAAKTVAEEVADPLSD